MGNDPRLQVPEYSDVLRAEPDSMPPAAVPARPVLPRRLWGLLIGDKSLAGSSPTVIGASCFFYMSVSLAMNLCNKQISHFNDIPTTIVAMQMAFACVFIGLLLFRTLRFGCWSDVTRWGLTVPIFWSLSICFNMLALEKTGVRRKRCREMPTHSDPVRSMRDPS